MSRPLRQQALGPPRPAPEGLPGHTFLQACLAAEAGLSVHLEMRLTHGLVARSLVPSSLWSCTVERAAGLDLEDVPVPRGPRLSPTPPLWSAGPSLNGCVSRSWGAAEAWKVPCLAPTWSPRPPGPLPKPLSPQEARGPGGAAGSWAALGPHGLEGGNPRRQQTLRPAAQPLLLWPRRLHGRAQRLRSPEPAAARGPPALGTRALWLDGNNFSSIPAAAFRNLSGLGFPNLQGSGLASPGAAGCWACAACATCNLERNRLRALAAHTFLHTPSAWPRPPSNNLLSRLDGAGLFQGLAHLWDLNLGWNSLAVLPDTAPRAWPPCEPAGRQQASLPAACALFSAAWASCAEGPEPGTPCAASRPRVFKLPKLQKLYLDHNLVAGRGPRMPSWHEGAALAGPVAQPLGVSWRTASRGCWACTGASHNAAAGLRPR